MIIVGLLVVTVVALAVTLAIQLAVFRKGEYKEMCQSEECVKTGTSRPKVFLLSSPSALQRKLHTMGMSILGFKSVYITITTIVIYKCVNSASTRD